MKNQKSVPVPSHALRIVKKFFPEVQRAIDATKEIEVEVTKADNRAKQKSHRKCALAVACERSERADGAIISVGSAYIIKDKVAIRYRVPQSVSREVTSFDRNAGFEPGLYRLVPQAPTGKIGAAQSGPSGRKPFKGHRHQTGGIRTSLLQE